MNNLLKQSKLASCATSVALSAALLCQVPVVAFAAPASSATEGAEVSQQIIDEYPIPEVDLDPRFWSAETVAALGEDAPEGAGSASLTGAPGMMLLANEDEGEEGEGQGEEKEYNVVAPSLKVPSTGTVLAPNLKTMSYWTKYEGRYNTVKGDGGRAFGCFQFDYRYSLRDFLRFAYALDPVKFESLKELATDNPKNGYKEDYSLWPDIRDEVADAWLTCYEADSELFSRAQDYYGYQVYYETARKDMAKMGIPIDNRHDLIKGYIWSLINCFGEGGYHHFVGGNVYKYVNGKLTAIKMPGAGLTNDMSDLEFITTLASYLENNILTWYPSNGKIYITRYAKNELKDVLAGLPDLVPGAWYTDYVNYVTSKKLISGYGGGLKAGRFGPEDRLTRGMAVTVLYRASGEKAQTASGLFHDVDAGDWYAEAVSWAKNKGIVNGVGDSGYFMPNDLVTREDLACMIARFADTKNQKIDSVSQTTLNKFADKMNISSYARQAIAWCASKGVITGKNVNGTAKMAPQDICRRAELAKMVTIIHRDII